MRSDCSRKKKSHELIVSKVFQKRIVDKKTSQWFILEIFSFICKTAKAPYNVKEVETGS